MVGFGVMCFGLWCSFVGYELGGLAVGLSFGDLVRVGGSGLAVLWFGLAFVGFLGCGDVFCGFG